MVKAGRKVLFKEIMLQFNWRNQIELRSEVVISVDNHGDIIGFLSIVVTWIWNVNDGIYTFLGSTLGNANILEIT